MSGCIVALQALYRAKAAGKSIESPDEDKALFNRYAAAYKAANGPHAEMVEVNGARRCRSNGRRAVLPPARPPV